MQRKKARFNEKIALEVFRILDDAWANKKGIFSDIILPQDLWISKNLWKSFSEKDQANFLFYGSLPMRGGLVSEDPFKWLWALRQKFPEMFDPKIVSEKWSPEKIKKAFKSVTKELLNGIGTGKKGGGALSYKMKQHAENWYKNSKNLYRFYESDIRNVFKHGVIDFEEAFRRIDYKRSGACFFGMRRKIFSLLTIFLQEKNLIPVFPTPIPVDFHALRILWSTKILILRDWAKPFKPTQKKHPKQLKGKLSIRVWESLTDQTAKWSQEFLEKHKISHLNINPALWVLSRSLCSEHLQTSSRKDGKEFFTKGRLMKNPNLWPKNYKNPCSFCFVEKFCKYAIPAAPYYTGGLLIRMERVPYIMRRLSGINWSEVEFFKPQRNRRGAG